MKKLTYLVSLSLMLAAGLSFTACKGCNKAEDATMEAPAEEAPAPEAVPAPEAAPAPAPEAAPAPAPEAAPAPAPAN